MTMIRCALDRPDLGQTFRYLGCYYITHRKFSRATWSWKVSQKLVESQKFRESQLALKSQILYFPLILNRSFISTHRMIMIWCLLDSLDLGKAVKQLGRYHVTHRKFSRAPWSRNVSQKLDESQKFRESQLALKSQILYFPIILKRSFISTHRMIMIWCSLDSFDLGKVFKQLGRYHITHRKFSRNTWSWLWYFIQKKIIFCINVVGLSSKRKKND